MVQEKPIAPAVHDHEEELIAVPIEVNVVLAFLPRVVMAPMQTTMIRASITAYSTAVGPSSRCRKSKPKRAIRDNMANLSGPEKSRATRAFWKGPAKVPRRLARNGIGAWHNVVGQSRSEAR